MNTFLSIRTGVLFFGCAQTVLAQPTHEGTARLPPAPRDDAFYAPPSPLPEAPPGTPIWLRESKYSTDILLQTPDESVRAWQLLYHSRSALDQPIAVGATLMVPRAPYPHGPRPLIGHATGSVGMGDQCAPSKKIATGSYVDPLLPAALAQGWAVVLTDYQGLGTPGDHPWVVGRALGHSVLDALRAALALDRTGISKESPIALWGYSEGGFATASAVELLPDYAPELNVVAAAPGGLGESFAGLLDAIDTSPFNGPAFLMAMVGLHAAFPELELERYLNQRGKEAVAIERTLCIFDLVQIPFMNTPRSAFTTADPWLDPGLQGRLEMNRLGRRAPALPLYLYHADKDEMVPIELGRKLRDAYCARGAQLSWSERRDADHITGQSLDHEQTVAWVADRFAARPWKASGCPSDSDDAGVGVIAATLDAALGTASEFPRDGASPRASDTRDHSTLAHDARAAESAHDAGASDHDVADAGSANSAQARDDASSSSSGASTSGPTAASDGCAAAPQSQARPSGFWLLLAVFAVRTRGRRVIRARRSRQTAALPLAVALSTLSACGAASEPPETAADPVDSRDKRGTEDGSQPTLVGSEAGTGAALDGAAQAPFDAGPSESQPAPFDAGRAANDAASAADASTATRRASSEWHSYGHDLSNTRANSTETLIGVDNVAALQLVWSWEKSAVTGTPVYFDGKIYFGDLQANVVALDAKSGREEWRVTNPDNPLGFVYGSATVTEDALFYAAQNAYLARIERSTGRFAWSVQIDSSENTNIFSSPALMGERLILGVASYQNVNPLAPLVNRELFRGNIQARDSRTGAALWRFDLTEGTGVAVCSSAAIDPARKQLFIGTGQNYDSTDSPYADSLVSLNYETGEYLWHQQFTPNDEYSLNKLDGLDHDVLSTPVLFSLAGQDMVAVGDKGGTLFALQRDGKSVWKKQLLPGGHHGGVMGAPAYHDGVIYVCSGDFTSDENPDGVGQSGPSESAVFALHAHDGSELWTTSLSGLCYGALSYANGVVYLPSGDGNLRAFDARNGKELWKQPLGQSSAGGVSIAASMLFVSYGWDWALPAVAGGVKAFALP